MNFCVVLPGVRLTNSFKTYWKKNVDYANIEICLNELYIRLNFMLIWVLKIIWT